MEPKKSINFDPIIKAVIAICAVALIAITIWLVFYLSNKADTKKAVEEANKAEQSAKETEYFEPKYEDDADSLVVDGKEYVKVLPKYGLDDGTISSTDLAKAYLDQVKLEIKTTEDGKYRFTFTAANKDCFDFLDTVCFVTTEERHVLVEQDTEQKDSDDFNSDDANAGVTLEPEYKTEIVDVEAPLEQVSSSDKARVYIADTDSLDGLHFRYGSRLFGYCIDIDGGLQNLISVEEDT